MKVIKCKNTIPKELSLHDNRCWLGLCECGRYVIYCEYLEKYICCKCCHKIYNKE
jgi:hypothetical protein